MIGRKFSIGVLYSCTSCEEVVAAFVLEYSSKEVCRTVLEEKDNVLLWVRGRICFLARVITVMSPSWVKFGWGLFDRHQIVCKV